MANPTEKTQPGDVVFVQGRGFMNYDRETMKYYLVRDTHLVRRAFDPHEDLNGVFRYVGNVDSPRYGEKVRVEDTFRDERDGQWVDSVLYYVDDYNYTPQHYGRTFNDFILNFERVA